MASSAKGNFPLPFQKQGLPKNLQNEIFLSPSQPFPISIRSNHLNVIFRKLKILENE